jgi:hypothetical protein
MAINVTRLVELGMVPELAKELASQIDTAADPDSIQIASFDTGGGTTIPAGTLTETLQAIADLADPAP